MRQALINKNADLVAENHRYVMRITGNDKEGQDQLGNFIGLEAKYPVLVTTSRLLSTGVDAQIDRLIALDREVGSLIALDREVGSMTEFKQIVGRGTRVHEDTRKFNFTLIDFRGATSHFADPDFDGEPLPDKPGSDEKPSSMARQTSPCPSAVARRRKSISMASGPPSSPNGWSISIKTASSSPKAYATSRETP